MNTEMIIQAIIVAAVVAFVAYFLSLMAKKDKRKDDGIYGYFKREREGVSVDVVMLRDSGEEVVIKSFEFHDTFGEFGQDDNRQFAHVLADELLYYLNQDYAEQLTDEIKQSQKETK